MTQTSFPWGGTTIGDHGPYTAEQWQALYARLLGVNNFSNRGGVFFDSDGDNYVAVQHSPTAEMSIDVGEGTAMVDGAIAYNDALVNLAITTSHATLDRIDLLILRLDATNQTVRLVIKDGTPDASPVPPTLQTDRSPYYEIGLYQIAVDASVTQIFNADLTRIARRANDPIPAGAMMPYGGATAPDGWLLCYGQAVSRATYRELFDAIGTAFGVGDGSTTFNVPDTRGRVLAGLDNLGGSSANRITDAQADSMGGNMGAESHTLTVAQLAAHRHTTYYMAGGAGPTYPRFEQSLTTNPTAAMDVDVMANTGSNGAHNNVQPTLFTSMMIHF